MKRPPSVERAISSLLESPGRAATSLRRAIFDRARLGTRDAPEGTSVLLDKIADQPWAVDDGDISRAREAGYSEDELFEVILAAATGAGARRLDAGLRALDEAQ